MSGWTGASKSSAGWIRCLTLPSIKAEQHTFTIDAKVSGEAKLVLTQDNKTATTLWEDGDAQKTTKTLTLQPGRWRVAVPLSAPMQAAI